MIVKTDKTEVYALDVILPTNSFAANLHRIRKRQNVTQRALGEMIGTHYGNVSKTERGCTGETVRLSTVKRYADALGVHWSALID